MYLKKDLLLNTNVYDIVFYWIVHLKKNILYLKRCGYVFSILVVDKTYASNVLGFLIPSWIRFIYIHHTCIKIGFVLILASFKFLQFKFAHLIVT